MNPFTEVNPDKGTETLIENPPTTLLYSSLQKLTPIRGRKHLGYKVNVYDDEFTEVNPDKGTETKVAIPTPA